jgi:hypothetical protein
MEAGMNVKTYRSLWSTVVGAVTLAIGIAVQNAAAQDGRTVEQQFKNIQALKGQPAQMLNPTMVYFEAALGVGCPFCHDADGNKRDADTNPRKAVARRMIAMVNNINQSTFGGKTVVTCVTCHQGRNKPIGQPVVLTDPAPPALGEAYQASLPKPAPIPNITVDQVFGKYVAALGGADAIQKVSSLTARGEVVQRRPARDFPSVPLEISAKAPGMQLIVSGSGEHLVRLAYNGKTGWTAEGDDARDLRQAELEGKRLEDAFNIATQLKEILVNPKMDHPQVVNGREVYVVSAQTQALPLVKLYFDKDSGMLVRLTYYTDTIFGPYPTQIEYRDFRTVNGRKIPATWVILDARNREYTYLMQDIQAASVADGVFAKPAR